MNNQPPSIAVRAGIGVCVLVALGACQKNPSPRSASSPKSMRVLATPAVPGALSKAHPSQGLRKLPSTDIVAAFIHSRRPKHEEILSSSGPANDNGYAHQDAGIFAPASTSMMGVAAFHRVYRPKEVPLPTSGNADLEETLFAPTTKAPNGCIEVGTRYRNRGGVVSAEVYAFDFCSDPPQFSTMPLNDDFFAKYVVTNKDGWQGYEFETISDASTPGIPSTWRTYLYNYHDGTWGEPVYVTTGTPPDRTGWSIFEPWYAPNQDCPKSLPTFSVSNLEYYNATTRTWNLVVPQMDGFTTSVNTGGAGGCFNSDKTGPATYKLNILTPNHRWNIVSI